jgi:hypothetical protein
MHNHQTNNYAAPDKNRARIAHRIPPSSPFPIALSDRSRRVPTTSVDQGRPSPGSSAEVLPPAPPKHHRSQKFLPKIPHITCMHSSSKSIDSLSHLTMRPLLLPADQKPPPPPPSLPPISPPGSAPSPIPPPSTMYRRRSPSPAPRPAAPATTVLGRRVAVVNGRAARRRRRRGWLESGAARGIPFLPEPPLGAGANRGACHPEDPGRRSRGAGTAPVNHEVDQGQKR